MKTQIGPSGELLCLGQTQKKFEKSILYEYRRLPK